jgi:hypothetical protein
MRAGDARSDAQRPGPPASLTFFVRLHTMTITKVERAGYATDGGSIYLELSCADGARHNIMFVQELIPIKSSWFHRPKEKNGDVFLDGRNIVGDRTALQELDEAIEAFLSTDTRRAGVRELPKNTLILGDDLKELASKDQVGGERLLLTWARQRLERKLKNDKGEPVS